MPDVSAMIFSVGGTEKPIIFSTNHYEPEFLYFFCSHGSCDTVPKILEDIQYNFNRANKRIKITEDPENLVECFKVCEEIFRDLIRSGFPLDKVLVDYTGGTKNMTAALALASARFGIKYAYVGGSARTKDGLGIVIDGKEMVKESFNPWIFFAIDEKRKIAQLFNNFQFGAAYLLIDEIINRIDENIRPVYRRLQEIIYGFDLWDHFKYPEAFEYLSPASVIAFGDVAAASGEKTLSLFADTCLKPAKKLENLYKKLKTHGAKVYDMVFDLLSNAERRKKQGQFDDAIMRLYRALEMVGQVELQKYDVDDSDVQIDNQKLNEEARNWLQKEFPSCQKIKLALENKFELLNLLGNKLGMEYIARKSNFRKVISQRNESFLAHSFRVLGKNDYERFKDILFSFIGPHTQQALTIFPQIEIL